MRIAACTVCSWNYVAYAETLRASFLKFNPNIPCFIFIADIASGAPVAARRDYIILDETIMPNIRKSSLSYKILELNTSTKPFCVMHILNKEGFDACIYLDADIFVTDALTGVVSILERGFDAVITPHILAGYEDDSRFPREQDLLKTGSYNAGFLAFRASEESNHFLRWWAKRLETKCLMDTEDGLFCDQKYCDFIPSFIERTFVLRDPGYNLAYWNIEQRPLTLEDGTVKAGGSPAVFIHFSGLLAGNRTIFAKYSDRIGVDDIGPLRPVFETYHDQLAINDLYESGKFSDIKYGLTCLADGTPISEAMRRCLKFVPLEKRPDDLDDPAFEDAAETLVPGHRPVITRLAYEVYKLDPNLQRRFGLDSRWGRLRYALWCRSKWAAIYHPGVQHYYQKIQGIAWLSFLFW